MDPYIFWHISWKKQKYLYSTIYARLYYKFQKSKIKNKNSFVFVASQYLSGQAPSFGTSDFIDGADFARITLFSLDTHGISWWIYSWSLCLFPILPLYWIFDTICPRTCSFLSPLSYQKRTTKSTTPIQAFRYSGNYFCIHYTPREYDEPHGNK